LKSESVKLNLSIPVYKKDARSFDLGKKYDVILNLFTAFGYGSKEDDRKIIRNVKKHLKSGGLFFIDIMHLAWLLRNYKPRSFNKYVGMQETATRRFDLLTNTNYETHTLTRGRSKKIYKDSLHIYSLAELRELLEAEGLKVLNFWGSFKGLPLTLDSKRLIVLAKKI
jgi:hypothetical protein